MNMSDVLRGAVTLKIKIDRPERFLNAAAKRGIEIRNVIRVEDGLFVRAYGQDRRKIEALEKNSDFFSVEKIKDQRLLRAFVKMKKRYFLLVGVALCIAAVWVSSLFIWQIDVYGNENITSSEILAKLDKHGVRIGTYRYGIAHEFVSNKMLLEIPQLSWITVNVCGSKATVLVREEKPAPELRDENASSIYASKEGIISKMTVTGGRKTVEVGDTVMKGDLLVTGDLSDGSPDGFFVRSDGEVLAKTWHELSAVMPLDLVEKSYLGGEKSRLALILGRKRVNLYFTGGNPWPSYDKITKYNTITVSTDTVLPITAVKETCFEYSAISRKRDRQSAETVLKARLLERLKKEIGNGSVISVDFLSVEDNGAITVTLFAECEEQIGVTGPIAEYETNDISSGGL